MMQFFGFLGVSLLLLLVVILGSGLGSLRRPRTRLLWLAGFLFLAKLASTFFSILPLRSLWGAYMFMADGLIFLACLGVLGYFLLSLELSDRIIRVFLGILFLQAGLLSLQVIWEAIGKGALSGPARAESPLTNSDYFISYLCLLIPIGVGLVLSAWRRGQTVRPGLYLGGLIICLAALYLSLPAELQGLLRRREAVSRMDRVVETKLEAKTATEFLENPSNNERFTQWRLGWKIGLKYPVFGSGPGTTRAAFFQEAKDLREWDYNIAMELPHNDLIQQFSQGGLPGLLSYVLLWAGAGAVLWKNRLKVAKELRPLWWSLLGGMALFVLFNQFVFTVQVTALVLVLFLVAALRLAKAVEYEPVNYRKPFWLLWAGLAILLALPVGFLGWRYFRAEVFEHRARVAEREGDLVQAGLMAERAVSLYPYDENYWMLASGYHTIIGLRRKDADLLGQALREADRAVALNPYLPKNNLNRGLTRFVSAEAGSAGQEKGLTQMSEAIAALPWNSYLYLYAVQGLLLKPNPEAAESLFGKLEAAAPGPMLDYLNGLRREYDQVMAGQSGVPK